MSSLDEWDHKEQRQLEQDAEKKVIYTDESTAVVMVDEGPFEPGNPANKEVRRIPNFEKNGFGMVTKAPK